LDQQLSAALPARNPGQLKIAETALRGPLVIEPELQDPGALAHRILAHGGDFLLPKRMLDVFTNARDRGVQFVNAADVLAGRGLESYLAAPV